MWVWCGLWGVVKEHAPPTCLQAASSANKQDPPPSQVIVIMAEEFVKSKGMLSNNVLIISAHCKGNIQSQISHST